MYEDYLEFFANRLAKLRMEKGVSAREMSLSIGQGKGYIAQIERKHNLPSMTGFFYICEYLGISPEEFFYTGTDYPASIKELLKILMNLNGEQLSIIKIVANGLSKTNK